MPVIKEQHDSSDTEAPALPEKSPLRYTGLEVAALHENIYQYPPPAYSRNTPPSSASADTPKHEVATRSRKPTWITTRGGWWRLAFIALVTTACVLALVLGLALGLRHNKYDRALEVQFRDAGY